MALAFLASVFILALFRMKFPSDQLYYIRTEQLFGLLAVVLVYMAVVITPLNKLLPSTGIMNRVLYARRGIGVAAAYFASLHAFISIERQLGGLGGALLLPSRYKLSFGLAAIALVILIVMAFTSFDKAIKVLTFRRWKQVHRFIYLAGVLIVVHVWLIGTHVDYAFIRYTSYGALGLLLLLESIRFSVAVRKKWQLGKDEFVTLLIGLCVISAVSIAMLQLLAQGYHNEHAGTESAEFHGHSEYEGGRNK